MVVSSIKFLIIPAILSLAVMHASGQAVVTIESAPAKLVKQYESAAEALANRDFQKAVDRSAKLIEDAPEFIDAVILYGEATFMASDTALAIQALQDAIDLDSTYDPRVWFSMSRIYEMQGSYGLSANALESYLRHGDLSSDRRERLVTHLENLRFRKRLVDNPVQFDPVPVPGVVNTEADEALPAVTIDGSTMIFTRRDRGYEDMYIAAWDSAGAQWVGALPMQAINTPQNEGAHTISANGRVLVFTSCNRSDGLGSCDLYLTFKLSSGRWSDVRNLTGINTRGWEGQPALTADGRGLYFSSDRPGGEGKRDIWYTRITDNGWTDPVNLGPVINTSGNESSPFIHRDDRTLYFMSDGHPGMGDYDLFVSRFENGAWEPPENLGYPINTPGREGALTVHPDGHTAYYTRESSGLGTMDIYQFDLPPEAAPDPVSYLDLSVIDEVSGEPVRALAWIYSLADSSRRDRYVTDDNGKVTAALPHGRKYGLHIVSPDYVFYSDQFDLDKAAPYQRIGLTALLQKVKVDTAESGPVILKNVEFASGSAELLASSNAELVLLLELLNGNSDLRIEIRGHTDNVGDPDDNLKLSEERAKAVYEWLIENGIDAGRLSYKGLGESQPVASNDGDEGRQRNRRTEFVIIQ